MKKLKLTINIATLLIIIAFGAVMVLPAGAGEYELDPAHSQVGFAVKHMVIAKVRGAFESYTGGFSVDNSNQLTSARATVEVSSINTKIEKRDNHLKSEDFFFASKFPKLTFVSKSVKKTPDGTYTLTGDITIRGVTKEIVLKGETFGPVKDPSGNLRMGFSATGSLDRRDFGLTWNKVIETGGLLVANDVKIELDGEGVLKK